MVLILNDHVIYFEASQGIKPLKSKSDTNKRQKMPHKRMYHKYFSALIASYNKKNCSLHQMAINNPHDR